VLGNVQGKWWYEKTKLMALCAVPDNEGKVEYNVYPLLLEDTYFYVEDRGNSISQVIGLTWDEPEEQINGTYWDEMNKKYSERKSKEVS